MNMNIPALNFIPLQPQRVRGLAQAVLKSGPQGDRINRKMGVRRVQV